MIKALMFQSSFGENIFSTINKVINLKTLHIKIKRWEKHCRQIFMICLTFVPPVRVFTFYYLTFYLASIFYNQGCLNSL